MNKIQKYAMEKGISSYMEKEAKFKLFGNLMSGALRAPVLNDANKVIDPGGWVRRWLWGTRQVPSAAKNLMSDLSVAAMPAMLAMPFLPGLMGHGGPQGPQGPMPTYETNPFFMPIQPLNQIPIAGQFASPAGLAAGAGAYFLYKQYQEQKKRNEMQARANAQLSMLNTANRGYHG